MADVKSTLDELTKYTSEANKAVDEATKEVDRVAKGTSVGDGFKQGLKGAATGMASGAGVGTTVAGVAVAVGALTTTAVAAQAIPVVGTIVGAVAGIIAGLVAFFAGKNKAKKEAGQKELQMLRENIVKALSVLPPHLRARAESLVKATIENAYNLPAPSIAAQAANVWNAHVELPSKIKDLTIQWVKEEAEKERTAKEVQKKNVTLLVVFLSGTAAMIGGIVTYKKR